MSRKAPIKIITDNLSLSAETLNNCFTRNQLRKIASCQGITLGATKLDTARNITTGVNRSDRARRFPVTIIV